MTLCRQSDLIEVRRADLRGRGGRGVFAVRDIPAETTLERVPVLLIPREQVFGVTDAARKAVRLSWYVFDWEGTKRDYVALSLGYGSIYNHSAVPNAHYISELPDVMEFISLRDIAAGEEIFINYAGSSGKPHTLGFEVHGNRQMKSPDP